MEEDLTPLGRLLESARKAIRPKLSQNAAAKRAGTSGTTYRRIIRGVSRFGGQDIPFEGAADTVAQIAGVLGVTPGQLREVDRADAARELEGLAQGGVVDRILASSARQRRVITDEDMEGLSLDELEELAQRLLDRIEARLPPRKQPTIRLSKEAVRSVVGDPPGDEDHS